MLLDLPTDSQEAVQVVWHCHLFKNFPQFVVIHTVKGFGIVNKAEVDVFLELSYFSYDPTDVGNLISCSSAFSKPAWTSGNSWFTYWWSLAWRILSITLLVEVKKKKKISWPLRKTSDFKSQVRAFPGGPGVRTEHFHCHFFFYGQIITEKN